MRVENEKKFIIIPHQLDPRFYSVVAPMISRENMFILPFIKSITESNF